MNSGANLSSTLIQNTGASRLPPSLPLRGYSPLALPGVLLALETSPWATACSTSTVKYSVQRVCVQTMRVQYIPPPSHPTLPIDLRYAFTHNIGNKTRRTLPFEKRRSCYKARAELLPLTPPEMLSCTNTHQPLPPSTPRC